MFVGLKHKVQDCDPQTTSFNLNCSCDVLWMLNYMSEQVENDDLEIT